MNTIRVLIMEHEERVCRVLCRIVKRMGYEPFPAADYEHFKALYNEAIPDIILLNLKIAGNDNTEFCRYLVEQKSPATIILLSDREEDETADLMKLGLSAGLNMGGVLRKPVDVEAVKELLAGRMPPQPSSPLKKSHEHGRLFRIENQAQAMMFDPDQLFKQTCCARFDTSQLTSNREFEVYRMIQGVTL
ncbi:MAG: histidine kinase [Gammaproteobacteria bacterium]|nr:histidine kinase [Gammaproteobacteria bacterium]